MFEFIGFVKEHYKHEHESLPCNARIIPEEASNLKRITAGLMGIAIGYGLLLLKQYKYNNGDSILNKPFILAGIILGVLLLLPHEILHLIPYPKNSTKKILIRNWAPSAYCSAAVSKRRFIISSLLPILLGIVPLLLFMITSSVHSVINTILWTAGTIGLATPANDYIDAFNCFIKAPSKSMIQSGNDGFYYFSNEK